MSQNKGAAAKREKKTPKAAVWGDDDDDYDSEEADQAFGLETENSMSGSAPRKTQASNENARDSRNNEEVSSLFMMICADHITVCL